MPRTRYGVYYAAHPRFIEAYSHLEALWDEQPELTAKHATTLARIRNEMLLNQRLTEGDRRKVRDILRQLRRPMPRAFVGRVGRQEPIYKEGHALFQQAKKDLEVVWEQFGHTSTPPKLKPAHASLLRDVHDMMAFRHKLYESQRRKLYEIIEEMRPHR